MWKVFIFCLFFSPLVSGIAAAQSVDELLREADLTLSGKKGTGSQNGTSKSRSKRTSGSDAAKTEGQSAAEKTVAPETTAPTESQNLFNPTEAAQILRADLQALKEEQTKRDPRVDFSVLAGQLTFSPSFQLYKDDDTFRLEKTAKWTGATVETSAGWTLYRLGNFALQGVTAGSLGFYSGNGVVNRSGIQSKIYEMQFMTVPIELGVGLGIIWNDLISLGFRIGPALNVVNQKGDGTQDTLSGVFSGDMMLTSLKVRLSSAFCLRADYRRQGIMNTGLVSQAAVFGFSYNLH